VALIVGSGPSQAFYSERTDFNAQHWKQLEEHPGVLSDLKLLQEVQSSSRVLVLMI
jgi:hypothetical protein